MYERVRETERETDRQTTSKILAGKLGTQESE
jgi:hypothetical protein